MHLCVTFCIIHFTSYVLRLTCVCGLSSELKLACIKHNRILQAAGRARFALSGHIPYVAHVMLVMVLNLPEQCSFQDLLFHLFFMPKSAGKSASRMDISLLMSSVLGMLQREVGVAVGN